jgi:hypothetical protein
MDYHAFISSKTKTLKPSGFDVDPSALNAKLFPFQSDIVARALHAGRYCMFEDCGLGKTPQQLEWAHQVCRNTGGNVLIFTPLAVAEQTKKEADKFGIGATVCRGGRGDARGIIITNYEQMNHFDAEDYSGIVLDESSILKNYSGSTRKALNDFADNIPYRLACTATPAPNDLLEIINHADFHGIRTGKEIIALYFRQDGNTTQKYRLKTYAVHDFWQWVASWAVAVRKPSDLGYCDDGFNLPELRVHKHIVDGHIADGFLFPVEACSLQERRQAARESISQRVSMAADMANAHPDEPAIVWCNLNDESAALAKAVNGAVEVRGSDSNDHKVRSMLGFADGSIRALVTKPSIAGFGMNWQHCATSVFVGLNDSYEQFYQALRRCWRFGQKREVNAHVICAETEMAVLANIDRKQRDSAALYEQIISHMGLRESVKQRIGHTERDIELPGWLK